MIKIRPLTFPHRNRSLSGALRSLSTRSGGGRAAFGRGFTLLELLVAMSIMMFLVILLTTALGQALDIWRKNESASTLRESTRSIVELMTSELRQATLPLDRTEDEGLQMLINPGTFSGALPGRDSIFWQAPVGAPGNPEGLAIVGYFIRHVDGRYRLCRAQANPGEPLYQIYNSPADWANDALVDGTAPGDNDSHLKGVVMENVPAMWVRAYQDATTAYPAYDSRTAGKLPYRIEVSFLLMSEAGADMIARGEVTLPDVGGSADIDAYIAVIESEEPKLRQHLLPATVNVPMTP